VENEKRKSEKKVKEMGNDAKGRMEEWEPVFIYNFIIDPFDDENI
jgi:hypothetical protein